jgi:ATP-dependent Clp protease, protease subunit
VRHVFLSYSHRNDSSYVEALAAHLADAGVPVWFDREIIVGRRWDHVIKTQLDTCAAVIVVMTPEAEDSTWVSREINYAEARKKPILPLLLRGDPFFRLGNIQYENVTGGSMPSARLIAKLRSLTLPSERSILLEQQIDDGIANRICSQILLLAAENKTRDIVLCIDSPGGSVTAGMAIYDTMEYAKCDIATVATGLAAGMGQVLLSAGTRGKRYAQPHTRIMMCQPSAGVGGTESDIAIQAELFRRHKQEMAHLIAESTGQTVERIMADWDPKRWFTAEEAREYGFIDHIIPASPSISG